MQVVPVIDIRGGVVVHATGGDRDGYRPIVTPLAEGSDPVAVVAGFRGLYPFSLAYVADLDGIAGRPRNLQTLADLASTFTDVTLWVDAGSRRSAHLVPLLEFDRVVPVIGSETLASIDDLSGIAALADTRGGWVLSLDFKADAFLGPPALLAEPALWPRRVVVMTLAAVGADAGPDLARVRQIKSLAGEGRQVFAAGGVRHAADLDALAEAGAVGVLVASALHAGKIKAGDLG